MKKPLVCFYLDNQYIYSNNYIVLQCEPQMSVTDFLKKIEAEFRKDLKVVQINFEFENQQIFQHQKELYPSSKATVFVLNSHEILPANRLLNELPSTITKLTPVFQPIEEKQSFIEKALKIKKEIAAGRIYQANLTSAFVSETTYSAEKVFKNLFEKFGGEYKALLPFGTHDLACMSPELFLKKQNLKIKTQPIKGSLADGKDLTKDLLENPKEAAELSMIVDLLRNDLNRLDETNSAKVTAHREIMKLGYIQHTYSEIEIDLEKDRSLSEIIKFMMPGGSISGCPKIESLKVIAENESIKRQAYTGTIGWWKDNNFCLNIAIRTFIKCKNQLFYHTGCGLVYDSDPEKEWEELVLKTGAINVQK